jgi:hypothetical protein
VPPQLNDARTVAFAPIANTYSWPHQLFVGQALILPRLTRLGQTSECEQTPGLSAWRSSVTGA